MIFWITQLRIRRIAAKDAKGQYGSFLTRRQMLLNKGSSAEIVFKPSDWMISLAIDYKNTVERLCNDKKYMHELNNEIKRTYAKLLEANNELNKQITTITSIVSEISAEIAKTEGEMEKVAQLVSDFNAGKPLPNGMTPHQLMRSKMELEQKYSQKQAQKKSLSDQSFIQAEHDGLVKDFRDKVIQLESNYSLQIDLLYKKIRKVEIKYNEQISFYWEKMCKYIQKNKSLREKRQTITITDRINELADFAKFCGVDVLSQEDLFESDRNFMNTIINTEMGIQFNV